MVKGDGHTYDSAGQHCCSTIHMPDGVLEEIQQPTERECSGIVCNEEPYQSAETDKSLTSYVRLNQSDSFNFFRLQTLADCIDVASLNN